MILIPRPEPAASALAKEVEALGRTALVTPVMTIESVPFDLPDITDFDALIFTSVHAVRIYSERTRARTLPVLAVGEKTAATAREYGHKTPYAACKTASALSRQIKSVYGNAPARLLYLSGIDVAYDIPGHFQDAAIQITRLPVYTAIPEKQFSQETLDALNTGAVTDVLFFSVRTAENFVKLVENHGCTKSCTCIRALCISDAVALRLRTLPWRAVLTAAEPTGTAVLNLLREEPENMTDKLPADLIIRKFGGVRPMAKRLGLPATTVQGWKKRGTIPENRAGMILQAAREDGLALDLDALQSAAKTRQTKKRDPQQQAVMREKANFAEKAVISVAVLFMLLIFGGAVFLAPEYLDLKERSTRIDTLEKELAAVDQKLKTLEKKQRASLSGRLNETIGNIEEKFGGNPVVEALDQRIDLLEKSYAKLKPYLGSDDGAELKDAMLAMQNDITALETEVEKTRNKNAEMENLLKGFSSNDLQAAAMLLTLTQFRESIGRHEPFEEDLESLRLLVGDNPELLAAIDRLTPYARNGVLSTRGLKTEFSGLAQDIVVAELQGEDVSWQDQVRKRMKDMVSIRKEGEPAGYDTEAIVARVESLLDQGNVEGAITELEKLKGPAATKAQPWIEDARGHVQAEMVYTQMFDYVIGRLSRGQKINPQDLERELRQMLNN